MTALLGLYVIITLIVATVFFYLWITKRPGEDWFSPIYVVGAFLAPLWPLYLVWVAYALIANPTTPMKGNE